MDAIEDSELAVHIPLKAIYESFICPICLNDITDCHITSCGHIFCEQCIRESLNRRHNCPLCNMETTQERLVKNHHFDNLLRVVNQQKESVAQNYVNHLVGRAAAADARAADDSRLSPIEQVYKKHTRRCLLAYEEYYEDLLRNVHAARHACRAQFSAKLDEIRAKMNLQEELLATFLPSWPSFGPAAPAPSSSSSSASSSSSSSSSSAGAIADSKEVDATQDAFSFIPPPLLARSRSKEVAIAAAEAVRKEYNDSMDALQRRFDSSLKLLVDAFENYMSSIAPSPFLLPVAATLSVEKRPALRFDAQLKPTDTAVDFKQILILRSKNNGDEIVAFSPDCKFFFKRVAHGPANAEEKLEAIPSETVAVVELKLPQGAEIVLKGTVTLQSEQRLMCFAVEFKSGSNKRVDYFKCKTCSLNWICKACSLTCHKGHQIQPFMLNHKPSYGCCYCVKKKKCSLSSGPAAAGFK